jgi:hypothetical protein
MNTTIGNKVTFDGGTTQVGEVVDEVSVSSPGYNHIIQRIQQLPEMRGDGDEYAYRFTYYALSGNKKVFGQYSPMLSERELGELLRQAHEKRWPIFQ